MVRRSPSSKGILGSQFRIVLARVISGLRRCGSSPRRSASFCTMPAGLLQTGDRLVVAFQYSHEGTAVGIGTQILWGHHPDTLPQRGGQRSLFRRQSGTWPSWSRCRMEPTELGYYVELRDHHWQRDGFLLRRDHHWILRADAHVHDRHGNLTQFQRDAVSGTGKPLEKGWGRVVVPSI